MPFYTHRDKLAQRRLQRQHEELVASMPGVQHVRDLLTRRLEDFSPEELAQLQVRVQDWHRTHCGREVPWISAMDT